MDRVQGEIPGDYRMNHPSALTDAGDNHPHYDRKRHRVQSARGEDALDRHHFRGQTTAGLSCEKFRF